MPFLGMPSAASHCLDLDHMIGGIRDLHNQPSLGSRTHSNAIQRYHRPSIDSSTQGYLRPFLDSCEFQKSALADYHQCRRFLNNQYMKSRQVRWFFGQRLRSGVGYNRLSLAWGQTSSDTWPDIKNVSQLRDKHDDGHRVTLNRQAKLGRQGTDRIVWYSD